MSAAEEFWSADRAGAAPLLLMWDHGTMFPIIEEWRIYATWDYEAPATPASVFGIRTRAMQGDAKAKTWRGPLAPQLITRLLARPIRVAVTFAQPQRMVTDAQFSGLDFRRAGDGVAMTWYADGPPEWHREIARIGRLKQEIDRSLRVEGVGD